MTFSRPVVELLAQMLDRQSLAVSASDFDATALVVIQAKKELADALAQSPEEAS